MFFWKKNKKCATLGVTGGRPPPRHSERSEESQSYASARTSAFVHCRVVAPVRPRVAPRPPPRHSERSEESQSYVGSRTSAVVR